MTERRGVWVDDSGITQVVRCEKCNQTYGPWIEDPEAAQAFIVKHRAGAHGTLSADGVTGGNATRPARDARIVELKKQGMSQRDIAEAVGMSESGLSLALRRLGVIRGAAQIASASAARDAEVLELRERGLTYEEIGLATGTSKGAVFQRFRRLRERDAAPPPAARVTRCAPERDAEILRLWDEGLTYTAIARAVGMTNGSSVKDALIRLDAPERDAA